MIPTRYTMLNDEEIIQIHEASMEVLQTVGLRLDHHVAQEKLAAAGARVDVNNQRVYLTPELVEQALKKAPGNFTCANHSSTIYNFLSNHIAFIINLYD